ncbi:multidrug resistance-associated ABC transporter [Mycena floridula]|nr:multidrug resistance-associated ABC transporter [Mycena floridula]
MRLYNPFRPPPAPAAFGGEKVLPEDGASYFSRLFFSWLDPLLDVGFSRPLQEDDLWQLPRDRQTDALTAKFEYQFYRRCPPEKRPRFIRETVDLETKPLKWPASWLRRKPKHDGSLPKTIYYTFMNRWLYAGILKLCSDTLKTTTPLLTKVILAWLSESYAYHRLPDDVKASVVKPRGIGYGIGLGFALFAMQEVASLMSNHYTHLVMINGLYLRSAVIGNVFRKSLRLSGRARLDHSVGQITTMISADATRFDRVAFFIHNVWVAPIQIIIGIGLLIGNLGYSALVGLAVLLLGFPIQMILVKIMFKQRRKAVRITDSRVRLTTEVLQGIRLLKYYAWEQFYVHQITGLREKEIAALRITSLARASLISIVTFIPIISAILSFITYALSGHTLNVATIFSSLQLFNIIRTPLLLLPLVLSALADLWVAMARVAKFLMAEELEEPYTIEPKADNAVEVDADFVWETAGKMEGPKFAVTKEKPGHRNKEKPPPAKDIEKAEPEEEETPFELNGLKFSVPKGSFVAIVGRVGSGKSSILQALIGEMRKTRGQVIFGGSIAYVPQSPWIRNDTLRDNVIFGQEEDDEKFWEIIRACSLEHDLEILPQGQYTAIGEKGINLSGGQKARVSLARAAYSSSQVVLLDDPLSAVDSHVGKSILENCLLSGPLAKKTRILVTHALHVLDKTDYIYFVEDGKIAAHGPYKELIKSSTAFGHLIEDYGSQDQDDSLVSESSDKVKAEDAAIKPQPTTVVKAANTALMQEEERYTGAVSWNTYNRYLAFGGGLVWAVILLSLYTLMQGAQVGNNLFLGFWTGLTIPGFSQGQYMAVYAGLGFAQAMFSFLCSFTIALLGLRASLNLFKAALNHVLRSPVSFFDTTPIGRILARLSKDMDTLDQELAMTVNQFLTTFSSVLGTVALVFYTFPLLGIIFAPMVAIYYVAAAFYRRTSVETKRLDSIMRSALYASYSESLTGLATIRAYGIQKEAVDKAENGLDMENRAYYMTISIQRWLGTRLDLLSNCLILGIALFAAGFRNSVEPTKIGVVLSYSLTITQVFSDMVTQFAQTEQNMNAVERVLVYSELPSEAAQTTKNDPPPSWPTQGQITFEDVEMAYREGLPLVLKGVSFSIKPGEKVGIVGRTGAGKSSLLQSLFRIVELQSGRIVVDGVDVREIGLDTLRSRLALVPQDSTLFLGTLRENLDPQNSRTDAELITVLQRAWLLPSEGTDPVAEAKFSLSSTVSDEGGNFSAGEKQLLALARALVKNSRIIILDEATSSVDVETDSKLQRTIQTEFASSTLLCIAHRLNTIAYYDRILVMDAGKVAEFDTVLNLFDKETSIFRSLCDEAGLGRADICRIREEATVSKA